MPTATRLPDLEKYYLDELRSKVLTERGMGIHASDLDLCPIKVYYRRRFGNKYPLSDSAILNFASGLAFEAFIGGKHVFGEKDGVSCSADDSTLWGNTELKSTTKGMDNFDPIRSYPWWLFRCMSYAVVLGQPINLVVFFWIGNRKESGKALRAWKFNFTDEELEAHWKEVLRRKEILSTALETGEQIPKEKSWGCKYFDECFKCEFRSICYACKGKPDEVKMENA